MQPLQTLFVRWFAAFGGNGNSPRYHTSVTHVRKSLPFAHPAALATACLLLATAGCHKQHGADVVASVNGHAIPRADLDHYFEQQEKGKQDQQPVTTEQADSDRLTILRGLIDQEIIEQRAAKMNLTATDDEVNAKLTEMKAPYTEDIFNQRLRQSGQTIDEVRRDLRRSITLDKLLNKEINSKINVTDAEVASYFNAHKADFNLIENRYHLAQVVVTSLPEQGASNLQGSKATNDTDARKKIQTLKNRIDASVPLRRTFRRTRRPRPTAATWAFPPSHSCAKTRKPSLP